MKKQIEIKLNKGQKDLIEYATNKFNLAVRLYLLNLGGEQAMRRVTLEDRHRHFVQLALHMIYLDFVHHYKIATKITIDDVEDCQRLWDDFFKGSGDFFTSVDLLRFYIQNWSHRFMFEAPRGLIDESRIGHPLEPIRLLGVPTSLGEFHYSAGHVGQSLSQLRFQCS